jgi:hypothetical protein
VPSGPISMTVRPMAVSAWAAWNASHPARVITRSPRVTSPGPTAYGRASTSSDHHFKAALICLSTIGDNVVRKVAVRWLSSMYTSTLPTVAGQTSMPQM